VEDLSSRSIRVLGLDVVVSLRAVLRGAKITDIGNFGGISKKSYVGDKDVFMESDYMRGMALQVAVFGD